MLKFFGTDGIRGVANRELTAELALKVGRAAGLVLGNGRGQPILVGRDPAAPVRCWKGFGGRNYLERTRCSLGWNRSNSGSGLLDEGAGLRWGYHDFCLT